MVSAASPLPAASESMGDRKSQRVDEQERHTAFVTKGPVDVPQVRVVIASIGNEISLNF